MDDLRTLVRDEMERAGSPSCSFDDLGRRRDRKRRNQRIGAGALAIILALVSFVALTRAFRTVERPADEPTPPKPEGIFSEVGGWIAYGNDEGIWALNPTQGGTPGRIELSERPGEPLAWSSDGSKLLVRGEVSDATGNRWNDLDLFVLNADGTETRLTPGDFTWTASLSPDGSQVTYSAALPEVKRRSGIYVVDAHGGSPRLLLASGPRNYPDGTYTTGVGSATFSPDGTQIAYFDGMGDWGNSLRVMNADGSGVQVLIDDQDEEISHTDNLAWSSDGSHLAFNGTGGGIWIVGVDGSGLTKVDGKDVRWSPTGSRLAFQAGSPSSLGLWVGEGIWVMNADGSGRQQVATSGREPVWSPDGSRIAYLGSSTPGSLFVADLDGTHIRKLGTLSPPRPTSVVWISASGEEQPMATAGGSGAAVFVYAIAVLGAMGALVIAWRVRRRTAAR